MRFDVLVNGYKQILHSIYSPKNYYERIHTFLKEYRPSQRGIRLKLQGYEVIGFINSTLILGIKDGARKYYWKMIAKTLHDYPRYMSISIRLAIQGFHLRKLTERVSQIQVEDSLVKKQLKALDGKTA